MPDLGTTYDDPIHLNEPGKIDYPSLYLSGEQAKRMLPAGMVGDERKLTATVRVASIQKSATGWVSLQLEFLEADWVEEKDGKTRIDPERMYPSLAAVK